MARPSTWSTTGSAAVEVDEVASAAGAAAGGEHGGAQRHGERQDDDEKKGARPTHARRSDAGAPERVQDLGSGSASVYGLSETTRLPSTNRAGK